MQMPAKIINKTFRKILMTNIQNLGMSLNVTSYSSDKISKAEHYQNICGRSSEHSNDIVFLKPSFDDKGRSNQGTCAKQNNILVYFGGDVQDLTEKMKAHRDHKRYLRWSLEGTAELLSQSYPYHSVLVVRPSRMERATFSCYDNFVESNFCGAPTHLTKVSVKDTATHTYCHALLQIKALSENMYEKIENNDTLEDIKTTTVHNSITLIGFSKGVVVLNQVLHDLQILLGDAQNDQKEKSKLCEFTKQIEKMIWLDGGHNGGKDTWITDEAVLETLAKKTNIKIEVKVTPYQVKDNRRPWIGQEEKRFRNILGNKFHLWKSDRLIRNLYFEEEEANIENHFRILTTLGCDK